MSAGTVAAGAGPTFETTDVTALSRRLRPLLTAEALMGFLLWVPVEKLFMTSIGFDAASIGVMAAAYAALTPVLEVPSGMLADRWSRRGVLMIAAGALALAALIGGLSWSVPTYVGSALVLAVYFAMYSGTMDAIVYDTVLEEIGTSERFEQQIGRVRAVESAALVAGALAGGAIAELASPRLTYFVSVPFAVLAIVALVRFDEPRLHHREASATFAEHIATTFHAIVRTPRLWTIVALAAFTAVLLDWTFEFGPLWLVSHHAADGWYGPYWALLMAALGIGGLLAGRIRLSRPIVRTMVILVLAAAGVALTAPSLPVVVVAQVVLVLLLLVASVRATQLLHDAVPSSIRTGVASGVSALGWLCFLPFAFVFGVLAKSDGVGTAAWMAALAAMLVGGALILTARPHPAVAIAGAEALTVRLLRDVRQCVVQRRNEIGTLDCDDIVELVTEFLEGDLSPHAELSFASHLRGCPGCVRYVDQVRQTVVMLRELPEPDRLAASERARLLAEFRDSLGGV